MDPQLTVLGSRPTASPSPAPSASPSAPPSSAMTAADGRGTGPVSPTSAPPRRGSAWRRLGAVAAAAVVAAAAAGTAAYAFGKDQAIPGGNVTLTDATGTLSVTVPAGWERFVSRKGWVPPGQRDGARKDYPALWVGSSADWNDVRAPAQGVFVAVLPSTQLPGHLPGHPECDPGPLVVGKDPDGFDQATTRYTGCPEGVVLEQATMLSDKRLVWVQVHADSVDKATEVLRAVDTSRFSSPS